MTTKLQQQLFDEMAEKQLFSRAQRYAFDYADHISERHVFPADDALAGPQTF